ncbi:hypothetical protein VTK73DRAFT_4216 [Phialemonium thermophilum]|uniref:Protein BTN n=1 Tax=Phialemonium thermophilum TaxID=223376 RepID=A0ABR3VAY9_9PEZI
MPAGTASSSLLAPEPPVASATFPTVAHPHHHHHHKGASSSSSSFYAKLRRARSLFFPYMLPLLLVYVAEYTINQGVAPTLLFPLDASPFDEFRAFYPFYGFLYQLGVFVSRSSTPFVRVRRLYVPALLQVANLLLLGAQALFDFLPSVYVVFAIVLWEGLLGGAVYVNTFAEIMERVPLADREFSLGATSVSDSGGICVAGVLGIAARIPLTLMRDSSTGTTRLSLENVLPVRSLVQCQGSPGKSKVENASSVSQSRDPSLLLVSSSYHDAEAACFPALNANLASNPAALFNPQQMTKENMNR